jgi:NRPS condensation-like uncharacterized protein
MSLTLSDSFTSFVADLLDEAARADDAEPRPSPGAVTVPFSAMDELCFHLDSEAYPWTIEIEVRAPGTLDERMLRAAVIAAAARHPMARARLRPYRLTDRQYQWEIAPELDGDALWVVRADDDEAMAARRAEILSAGVPLDAAPPFRVWLVRRPGGDSVILAANHVATDGLGALRVLRSIVRTYAGVADAVPALDLRADRDLAATAGPTSVVAHVERLIGLGVSMRRSTGRLSRIAPEGGADEPGFLFTHLVVPADRLAVVDTTRHAGATLNDVLLAALHLAIADWNADHAHETDRISVMMPMNHRPVHARLEGMGNFALMASVSSSPHDRDEARSLVAAIAHQTKAAKRSGSPTLLLDVLDRASLLPSVAKKAIPMLSPLSRDLLIDTAVLSNIGRVDEPFDFGGAPGGGVATELWFSPPARMPLGVGVGAITHAGDLHLSFRSCRAQFDAAAAAAFAGYFNAALEFVG